MKRLALIVLLTVFSMQVWGVNCSSSNITLSTQEDVDNFQATYGGGVACERVTGNSSLNGSDADGLTKLTSMDESLKFSHEDFLTDRQ